MLEEGDEVGDEGVETLIETGGEILGEISQKASMSSVETRIVAATSPRRRSRPTTTQQPEDPSTLGPMAEDTTMHYPAMVAQLVQETTTSHDQEVFNDYFMTEENVHEEEEDTEDSDEEVEQIAPVFIPYQKPEDMDRMEGEQVVAEILASSGPLYLPRQEEHSPVFPPEASRPTPPVYQPDTVEQQQVYYSATLQPQLVREPTDQRFPVLQRFSVDRFPAVQEDALEENFPVVRKRFPVVVKEEREPTIVYPVYRPQVEEAARQPEIVENPRVAKLRVVKVKEVADNEFEVVTRDNNAAENTEEVLPTLRSERFILDANQIAPRVSGKCFRFNCLTDPANPCCKPHNNKKRQIPQLSVLALPGFRSLVWEPLVLQFPGRVTATVTRVEKSVHWRED